MIIDIIVILLLFFSAYRGYKKGFVGIFISFIALMLSIILGFVFKEPVADFLYESTPVGITIEESVNKIVQENFIKNTKNENLKVITDLISNNGLNETTQISKMITMFILKIISFVLILLCVYVICRLLQMLLELFFSLPVISSLNKFTGAGINIFLLLIKIFILLSVIYFIIPIQKTDTLSNLIDNTIVTKTLYENNFFVFIIETNIKI